MTNHTKGLLCGVTAGLLWGTTFVAQRYLVNRCGLDPLYVAALRFSVATVMAVAWLLMVGAGPRLWAARREGPLLLLLGAVGMGLMGLCGVMSARYTQAVNTSLIINANTILVVLLGLVIGERMRPAGFLWLLIGLGGCFLVVEGQPAGLSGATNHLLGGALAAGAALCWAFFTVAGKSVSRRLGGPVASVWAMLAGAIVCLVVASIWAQRRPLAPNELLVLLFLALFPTAIAMLVWYKGLEYLDASAIAPTQYLAPLSSAVFAVLFLHETVTVLFVLGAVLIIGGTWMCSGMAAQQQRDGSTGVAQRR